VKSPWADIDSGQGHRGFASLICISGNAVPKTLKGRIVMARIRAAITLSLMLTLPQAAPAADEEPAEGENFYVSQCKICHGNVTAPSPPNGLRAPDPSPIRLALHRDPGSAADITPGLIANPAASPVGTFPGQTDERIAFTVPYGPNLRGIIGRPAGSAKGFRYSPTMLKTLKGMEWTEAALDVWITNTQAWVPGVYMYYRQADPEIRRKIILYLKANP
jgi:cytochrome c2